MMLLVDIGNSRVKWCQSRAGIQSDQRCFVYTETDLAECLRREFHQYETPGRILVSNVGGYKVGEIFRQWAVTNWSQEPELVVSEAQSCGVINAYSTPRNLGVDRWAAMIGAYSLFQQAVCIVDCGTAVTVDAISTRGSHLGGLILPGLAMMRRSLTESTDGISVAVTGEISLLTGNTEDGVAAGTMYAVVAAIEHIAGEVTARLGSETVKVITGGDAEVIRQFLEGDWAHEPALVLRGLEVMAR
ncbi:MAG: type III pantothenate kinase [Gammaproteobacteria bacterium]|nr:type III pantothenate kinase [Gammaproteobacteria bacterium]